MKLYRPTIRKITDGYHLEITHKESSMDNEIGCYINARHVNGNISNDKDAIRLEIEPDRKPVKVYLDGKEYQTKYLVIILQ